MSIGNVRIARNGDLPSDSGATLAAAGPDTTVIDTYGAAMLAGVLFPRPEANDAPIVVSAFGAATSVGIDTLAIVDVRVLSVTRGLVSFAMGSLAATASASSSVGTTAYATAETGATIAGADLSLVYTSTMTGNGTDASSTWWSELSKTFFFALDIHGIMPAFGPVALGAQTTGTLGSPIPLSAGNVAAFEAASYIYGDNALNSVSVDAIAVEDRLSAVTVTLTAVGEEGPVPPRDPDVIRVGGLLRDRITTGSGHDWAFGGSGDDTLNLGAGDNTGFGNSGDDRLSGGDGRDWFFGGTGSDILDLGGGDNIAYGGAGKDTILAGSGHDAIDAGLGDDSVDAGNGDNTLRLGGPGGVADGQDRYLIGTGADWLVVNGPFGRDTVQGFTVAQGDRIACSAGDWDSDAGLAALNGTTLSLQRIAGTAQSLVISILDNGIWSTLTLEKFFTLNPQYGAIPAGSVLTDAQALPLMHGLFVDADTHPDAPERLAAFVVGDTLSFLG